MMKEQLYDVFVVCKDGETYRNKEAIGCNIIEDYIKYVEENAKRVNKFVRKLIGGKKND